MTFETKHEIVGNESVGFFVYETTVGYAGRCESSSFLPDSKGMKKKFNTKEEAVQAIQGRQGK